MGSFSYFIQDLGFFLKGWGASKFMASLGGISRAGLIKKKKLSFFLLASFSISCLVKKARCQHVCGREVIGGCTGGGRAL